MWSPGTTGTDLATVTIDVVDEAEVHLLDAVVAVIIETEERSKEGVTCALEEISRGLTLFNQEDKAFSETVSSF